MNIYILFRVNIWLFVQRKFWTQTVLQPQGARSRDNSRSFARLLSQRGQIDASVPFRSAAMQNYVARSFFFNIDENPLFR